MVRLSVLGGLTLEVDGRPVVGRAAQRKRLALVAVLGSTRVALSRDKLVGLLWPEAEASTARHQLAAALYDVRQALGEHAIVVRGDDLRLDATTVECDARRFDELVDTGDREGAIGLYRGPFLDGFHLSDAAEFERWVDAERSRYAQRYSAAVEMLAHVAAARGEHWQSVELWTRLAVADPFSSRLAVELVRSLAAAGDPGAAIKHARSHMSLVRAEFHVEPDARLVALVEALKRDGIPRTAALAPNESTTSRARTLDGPVVASNPVAPSDPVAASGPAVAVEARRSGRAVHARRVAAVALGVIVAGVAGAVIAARRNTGGPGRPHPLVVVAPFENRTGDSSFDAVGTMAADWITHGISQIGLVEVVDEATTLRSVRRIANDTAGVPGDARMRAIARDVGAGVVVGGAFYRRGDSLTFQMSVTDADKGRVLRSIPVLTASAHDPMPGIDQLRERTVGALATVFDERIAADVAASSPIPTASAYLEYVQGLERLASNEHDEALAHLQRAVSLDSTFVLPLISMRFAYASRGDTLQMYRLDSLLGRMRDRLSPLDRYAADYMVAFEHADWEACYRAVKNAAALAPQSSWSDMVAYVALVRFLRPREAIEALERVDPNYGVAKTSATFWSRLSLARHLMGDQRGALAAAREGRKRFPFDRDVMEQQLAALAALGDVRAVQAGLEEMQRLPAAPAGPYWWPTQPYYMVNAGLELLAHGQLTAGRAVLESAISWTRTHEQPDSLRRGIDRTTRGVALYCLERWPEAQATFDTLLATGAVDWEFTHWRDPRYWLASLAARRGDRQTAERWASQVELPYARARVAAIFGNRAGAVDFLRRSIADGRDTHEFIDFDCDFNSLREYPPFRELLVPAIGIAERFRDAVRTALR